MTRRPKTAGFALVEALSALVITSLVLLTLSISAGLLLRNWERAADDAASLETLSTGLEALRADLKLVTQLQWPGVPGNGVLFHGDQESLTFTAARGVDGASDGYSLVTVKVEDNRRRTSLIRSTAPLIPGQPISLETDDSLELISGALEFRFAFREAGRRSAPEWYDRWPLGNGIPTAIRVSVVDASHGRHVLPPLIVTPRVDAEPACLDGSQGYCRFDPEREQAATGEDEDDQDEDGPSAENGDAQAGPGGRM